LFEATKQSQLSYNNGFLKGRNNATRIMVQSTTCDLNHRKNDVLTPSV